MPPRHRVGAAHRRHPVGEGLRVRRVVWTNASTSPLFVASVEMRKVSSGSEVADSSAIKQAVSRVRTAEVQTRPIHKTSHAFVLTRVCPSETIPGKRCEHLLGVLILEAR